MKNIKRHIIIKRIKEINAKKNYSGEASPYWDDMQNQKRSEGDGPTDDLREDPFANPDVLPEDSTPYHRPLTEQGTLMVQAIHETMLELTVQQQNILRLSLEGVWDDQRGERLYNEQTIAQTLGVSQQAVSKMLARIKTKVRRRYEKLKTTKD